MSLLLAQSGHRAAEQQSDMLEVGTGVVLALEVTCAGETLSKLLLARRPPGR